MTVSIFPRECLAALSIQIILHFSRLLPQPLAIKRLPALPSKHARHFVSRLEPGRELYIRGGYYRGEVFLESVKIISPLFEVVYCGFHVCFCVCFIVEQECKSVLLRVHQNPAGGLNGHFVRCIFQQEC